MAGQDLPQWRWNQQVGATHQIKPHIAVNAGLREELAGPWSAGIHHPIESELIVRLLFRTCMNPEGSIRAQAHHFLSLVNQNTGLLCLLKYPAPERLFIHLTIPELPASLQPSRG